MLRTVKRSTLKTMRAAGVFDLASRSRWRQDRLLILGYHGIAQHDEHEWDPALFMSVTQLEHRLATLREKRFTILPLAEAVTRLAAGRLRERSVALTFDDGYVDFLRLAAPLLKAYDAPATVYLTTYYAEKGLPIPGITAAYLLRMSRHFKGPLRSIPGYRWADFSDDTQRYEVSRAIGEFFAEDRTIPTEAKHVLLERLALEVGFDLAALRRKRLMHLMTPGEAREVAAMGFDIQLHTHRHQVPRDERLIHREIEENRERIAAYTGRVANHLCYPSGRHFPQILPWLRRLGVQSATTCRPGLASSSADPLLLPRFIDHSSVSQIEFEAWVSGVSSVLPHRSPPELSRIPPMDAPISG